MKKYTYTVEESSGDVRTYTIETDKPLTDNNDDCQEDILDAICQVGIPKEGTSDTVELESGQEVVVTFVGTDYGDDAQMDFEVDG